MTKTSVLSIRIDKETRKMLEMHANTLGMKISLLASHILREMTGSWVNDYARNIVQQYSLVNDNILNKHEFNAKE